MTSQDEIQLSEYIETLRRCLAPLPRAERDDIAEEIRVHVRERLASTPLVSLHEVLHRLGTPLALAREYQNNQLLQRASRSYSPFLMLRATLRWALTGFQGFLMFNIASIGYVAGVGFLLLALAKPFFPDMIGFWMGPHIGPFFGFRPENAQLSPAHELLGDWFVPLTLGLGILFTVGTTKLLRIIIARFGKLRFRLTSKPNGPLLA